jgi:desampylase
MFGDDIVSEICPTNNVAADPARAFEIEPSALFAAIRTERAGGPRLMGYYHSHPTGTATPSERDRIQALADRRLWLIVAGGQIAAWRMSETGAFESVPIEHAL